MRHALVTGGGKGIGKAITQALLDDDYAITISGRDRSALDDTATLAPDRIMPIGADVTDETAVAALVRAATDAYGPIDVLVNNAGIATSAPMVRTTLEEWNRHLLVNATGVFLCSRAVLPAMIERSWGRIVTIASVASHVGWPYTAAYTASKHAALGLTRVLAAELRNTGVTANCVCPNYVRTEMTERTIDNIRANTGRSAEQAEEAVLRAANQARLLEPGEVAAAVRYLVSDEAAGVNGESIILAGN
jgi:NAD(P)-dependent dehydrogenase (short-subunit alcohol dehydrogenase family)